jgi:hypothetical protein
MVVVRLMKGCEFKPPEALLSGQPDLFPAISRFAARELGFDVTPMASTALVS